ncbi:hypothetical protein [Sphingomonas sp.]|uniref:hypothetical protein n=1 Tax=Sphingomonas sp. TaxID=28214 RepID=UPI003AFF7AA9
MRRWWRRLFPAPPPPSVYLFRHLRGEGAGYDLDDLMTRHEGDPAYQDVIDTVLEMMLEHRDQALDRSAARSALQGLAMRLASQGR